MEKEIDIAIPNWFYELKKLPLYKNAVIAGGYLRDQNYGINPKDVDVFVPTVGLNSFYEQANLPENKALFKVVDYTAKEKGYGDIRFAKFDAVTLDGYEVDIMGVRLNVNDFGFNLIEEFPFANQQIFTDGNRLYFSEKYSKDLENHTMTLVNCDGISPLPSLMKKYDEMYDRLKYVFRLRLGSDYVLQKRNGDDWL